MMSEKQYQSSNKSESPSQYFAHYSGREGNITVISDLARRADGYVFTFYSDTGVMLRQGFQNWVIVEGRRFNPLLLVADMFLVISTSSLVMIYDGVKPRVRSPT